MINRASEKNKGQKYKSDLFFIEHFTFFKKHSTYLHFFSLLLRQTTYAVSRICFKNNSFQFSDTAGYKKGKEHGLLSSRTLGSEPLCTIN